MASRGTIDYVIGGLERLTEKVVIGITLEVHANLVEDTPVDTGWARANWVPQIGVPFESPVGDNASKDLAAVATAETFQGGNEAQLLFYNLDQGSIFITNNVPYLQLLNDGSSSQAPAGFIEAAIERALLGGNFLGSFT